MVYCFLAEGFEDIEAIAPIDVLKRGGISVKTVGVGSRIITSSHGLLVKADMSTRELSIDDEIEAVILPGGMPGTVNLNEDSVVHEAIDFAVSNGKLVCAICAAPSILGRKGLLNGKNAICYPGYEEYLVGAKIDKDSFVIKDDNFITARGAGVALDFGLEILSALTSKAKADQVKSTMQCR